MSYKPIMTLTLTAAQASMVATYACEGVHGCTSMQLAGRKLTILDRDAAIADLYDAADSADEDKRGSGATILRVCRAVQTA